MVAKVLIVEDDALQADDLEDAVASQGHDVCAKVRSAEAAIYAARTQLPQIVLMDVELAGSRDGIQAAEAIRAAGHPCSFVFVTAYSDEKTVDRMRRLEPIAILLKPASPASLGAAIQQAVEARH